jgi:GT2 family glycosyltransferase
MTSRRLAVVVLAWNGSRDTVACITALLRHGPKDQQIILVDNGSIDDTVQEVQKLSKDVLILELGENTGFSKGNNAGIKAALDLRCEVIGLLNNDAEVRAGFAGPLLKFIEQSAQPVAVSPAIFYRDQPEKEWFVGSRYNETLGQGVHATDLASRSQPFYLTGCALFSSADVWRKVGLLDERFFLNFEDLEWSRRAVACGVHLAVVPESVVDHGVSESISRIGALSTYLYARNGVMLSRSHLIPNAVTTRPFIWQSVLLPHLRLVRKHHPGSARALISAIVGIAHGWRQHPTGAPGPFLQSLSRKRITVAPPTDAHSSRRSSGTSGD